MGLPMVNRVSDKTRIFRSSKLFSCCLWHCNLVCIFDHVTHSSVFCFGVGNLISNINREFLGARPVFEKKGPRTELLPKNFGAVVFHELFSCTVQRCKELFENDSFFEVIKRFSSPASRGNMRRFQLVFPQTFLIFGTRSPDGPKFVQVRAAEALKLAMISDLTKL